MSAASLANARATSHLAVRDRVALVLALAGAAAATFAAFLSIAPNRLADGHPLPIWHLRPAEMAIILAFPAFVFIAAFIRDETWRATVLFASGAGLLIAILLISGAEATALLDPQEPARRISVGSAFWILLVVGLLASFQGLQYMGRWKIPAVAAAIAAILVIVLSGELSSLSLVREFQAQRSTFAIELLRHIRLVAIAVVLAMLAAVPLILAAVYRPQSREAIFTSLNLLQTIPSIALFGLLIAPLSFLASHVAFAREIGIAGIGATPAVIALVLYALLPLVRSADAGLRNVPADIRDAASGMGMTPREIFWKVDLPLAMPALVSGLRVAIVQSIGLATVAALIGAGGLGTFVFQGIGEYALDLVLVGALPIIFLAVLADALFQAVLAKLRNRL
jgi:osmoprotectant transport system permease protein